MSDFQNIARGASAARNIFNPTPFGLGMAIAGPTLFGIGRGIMGGKEKVSLPDGLVAYDFADKMRRGEVVGRQLNRVGSTTPDKLAMATALARKQAPKVAHLTPQSSDRELITALRGRKTAKRFAANNRKLHAQHTQGGAVRRGRGDNMVNARVTPVMPARGR